jgi:hypothetical protein
LAIPYPVLGYGESLLAKNSLAEINDFFVPNYTKFDDPESNYDA